MAVLVCGGAGYIGSHTVAELLDRGEEVVVVDNLQKGHKDAVLGGKLMIGDLRDSEFMDRVFQENEIESVIQFAADSQPRNIPIMETDPTEPTNPYGETKLSVEKALKWFANAYGIKYTALRYFNAAGAHMSGKIGEDHQPESHLIPIVLQAALGQRECVQIFGDDYPTPDGTCIRDYIHVTDLADAHVLALEKMRKDGKSAVYNLGNGNGFSVKEVVELARKVTGIDIPAKIAPRRAGDPAVLVASSDKAKKELGWKPQYHDLATIIRSAWEWHKSHPNGFEE